MSETSKSVSRFAQVLTEAALHPDRERRDYDRNRPVFRVGDGTAIVLGDWVIIPKSLNGPRANCLATVIKLESDGLGVRFKQKVGRVTREFFDWSELQGATVLAAQRVRKTKSVMPPNMIK